MNINGLHHITAIASDPARNVAFYTGIMGLRMIKKTVNYDDPQTYHLYYGDEVGTPGTILTFFPFAHARRGSPGVGQVLSWSYRVLPGSHSYWKERLQSFAIEEVHSFVRFGERGIAFRDPDHFQIELIESSEALENRPWSASEVPPEYAMQGFHGVTLGVSAHGPSGDFLEQLGAHKEGEEGDWQRFRLGKVPSVSRIDLKAMPDGPRGRSGWGTTHHIAFRTPSDEAQEELLAQMQKRGISVSPIRDRNYFNSIYFFEPGGVLLEIASDKPGFTIDEPLETLGSQLSVPPWLEPHRAELERTLPPLSSE